MGKDAIVEWDQKPVPMIPILSDPAIEKNVSSGSFMNSRYGGDVTNYFSSDGRGIRFNKEGDFIGFIEKNILGNE